MPFLQKGKPIPSADSVSSEFFSNFLCGCLVTNRDREIVYTNDYFEDELGWEHDKLLGKNISVLLTHASSIYLDCYVFPILAIEGRCEESQVTIIKGNGQFLATVLYVRFGPNNPEHYYWTIVPTPNRDKLYEELLATRKRLESQADDLKLLATTDELTGLKNRRELMHQGELLIQQAHRSGRDIAFLFIDIDHFKKINDTFGHPFGDLVLQQFGRILSKYGRTSDIIGRYGGEEFIVIIADGNHASALQYAQRIHKLAEYIQLDEDHLSVSIGISLIHSGQTTPFDELLEQADRALYHAKNTGRNRSIFADELSD